MGFIIFIIIVIVLLFVGPPFLVFVCGIEPKHEYIEVYKEEPSGDLEEDEVEYFLVDPDPYQ